MPRRINSPSRTFLLELKLANYHPKSVVVWQVLPRYLPWKVPAISNVRFPFHQFCENRNFGEVLSVPRMMDVLVCRKFRKIDLLMKRRSSLESWSSVPWGREPKAGFFHPPVGLFSSHSFKFLAMQCLKNWMLEMTSIYCIFTASKNCIDVKYFATNLGSVNLVFWYSVTYSLLVLRHIHKICKWNLFNRYFDIFALKIN